MKIQTGRGLLNPHPTGPQVEKPLSHFQEIRGRIDILLKNSSYHNESLRMLSDRLFGPSPTPPETDEKETVEISGDVSSIKMLLDLLTRSQDETSKLIKGLGNL